uniref:Uncharacterized protein n=1 Tax=Rhipicephalus pulchellus TaxID=72859 RepID=L7M025_RHIPC
MLLSATFHLCLFLSPSFSIFIFFTFVFSLSLRALSPSTFLSVSSTGYFFLYLSVVVLSPSVPFHILLYISLSLSICFPVFLSLFFLFTSTSFFPFVLVLSPSIFFPLCLPSLFTSREMCFYALFLSLYSFSHTPPSPTNQHTYPPHYHFPFQPPCSALTALVVRTLVCESWVRKFESRFGKKFFSHEVFPVVAKKFSLCKRHSRSTVQHTTKI